ncbi:HupE/UreJ family protein [Crenobacter caeni]|uniref:HupE/UreJ family protein n=1 Tax=Crenobacter caeni TaxID=2705474 RepID=A0A6B2KVD9_9NEIS|nr:HupE/UreJ family protein [Crenobacter caeni]NDV13969.1 HupE/UreJ family protein [Crenobacter caeni]
MKASRITLLFAAVATPAFAHTGVGHEFTLFAGLGHPLFGLDHLLAMVGVGVWAALQGGHARALVPAAFVLSMALGSVLGFAGVHLPAVESGIALSVMVFGLLIATLARLPLSAGVALTALFALVHGHAHGAEAPAAGAFWLYGVGFVTATALLHGAGYLASSRLQLNGAERLLRVAGSAMAGVGALLLTQTL